MTKNKHNQRRYCAERPALDTLGRVPLGHDIYFQLHLAYSHLRCSNRYAASSCSYLHDTYGMNHHSPNCETLRLWLLVYFGGSLRSQLNIYVQYHSLKKNYFLLLNFFSCSALLNAVGTTREREAYFPIYLKLPYRNLWKVPFSNTWRNRGPVQRTQKYRLEIVLLAAVAFSSLPLYNHTNWRRAAHKTHIRMSLTCA